VPVHDEKWYPKREVSIVNTHFLKLSRYSPQTHSSTRKMHYAYSAQL